MEGLRRQNSKIFNVEPTHLAVLFTNMFCTDVILKTINSLQISSQYNYPVFAPYR